jgi:hypothetical protein
MMNRFILSLVLCCAAQISLRAQLPTQAVPGSEDTNTSADVDYTVVARAANSRVWAAVVSETNNAGQVITVTNRAYTEIGANLCVKSATGEWSDSEDSLAIAADGANSANSPLAVHFAGNANAEGGTVRLTAPDGKLFESKVFGMSYYDPALGTNVLIAPLQSSQGTLVGNNHILYQNAFEGVNADLWYTYTISGLTQDIVLHDCPPSPADYGLNPQTTRLQVFTEWFNPPSPRQITAEDDGITHDAFLDFGNMYMGPGAALFTQGQADPVPVESGAIYKHWGKVSGRDMLVEEIRYPMIANLLQTLPLHVSAGKAGHGSVYESIAAIPPLRSKTGDAEPGTPVQVAKNVPRQPGLVLDYTLLGSITNFTFQCDTVYLLSNNVTMSGSNTIFEGGTVLKYASNATLTVNSPVTWLAGSYRPVVLTGQKDTFVGSTCGGNGQGTNYYANTALYYNASMAGTNLVLQHLRVMNARTGVAISGGSNHVLSHVQMVNCGNGLATTNTTFSLWNALMCNVMTNFAGTNSTGDVEHLTVDTANLLNTDQTLNMTNCLLVAVANTGSFTSNAVYCESSGADVFQTVGAGAHYLAADSPYVNGGTTNINPLLAKALSQMTTCPPVVVGGMIYTNITYSPEVQRDTDIPDVGYHYDPIDVAVLNCIQGATVTVLPGTTLATFAGNGGYGFWLYDAANLYCQGTATSPDYIVCYNTVQEQANNDWPLNAPSRNGAATWESVVTGYCSTTPTVADFSFTYWTVMAGDEHLYGYPGGGSGVTIDLNDCQFFSGKIYDYNPQMNISNSLLQRVDFYMWQSACEAISTNSFCNSLCVGGELYLQESCNGPWTFQNNLFDQTSIPNLAQTNDICGYNAYVTTTNGTLTSPTNTGDVVLSASPAYEAGALGQNYYPTNLLALIHAGSTSATNVGLYHYTVTTNNVIEGTNIVSIGFHYVAVGANGLPLDYSGGGIPDYLKDANGDGVYDAGDLGNWLVSQTCNQMPDYLMVLQGRNISACASVLDTNGVIGLQVYTPLQ